MRFPLQIAFKIAYPFVILMSTLRTKGSRIRKLCTLIGCRPIGCDELKKLFKQRIRTTGCIVDVFGRCRNRSSSRRTIYRSRAMVLAFWARASRRASIVRSRVHLDTVRAAMGGAIKNVKR
jgi:hypothetical protein